MATVVYQSNSQTYLVKHEIVVTFNMVIIHTKDNVKF